MLYYIRDRCNQSELNRTISEHDHAYLATERATCLAILPIAAAALVANSLALYIFTRQRFDNAAVRLSLLYISGTEVGLQCAVLAEAGIVSSGLEHWHTPLSFATTSCIHVAINALVSARNWTVLLICAARCEAVSRPLAARRCLLFNRGRLAGAFCLLLTASTALATAANLTDAGVLCTNLAPGSVVSRPLLRQRALPLVVYAFQALLPTLLIPVPTAVMWWQLRRSRRLAKCQHRRLSQQANSQRASRMVLGLAIVFCVLEFPTFVSTTALSQRPELLNWLPFHPDVVTNVLSVVDSLMNFFVYSASSAKFRADLRRLLCSCCLPGGSSGGCGGGGGGGGGGVRGGVEGNRVDVDCGADCGGGVGASLPLAASSRAIASAHGGRVRVELRTR